MHLKHTNAVRFGLVKIPLRRKMHLKMQMQCALVLQKSPLRRTFRYTSSKTKLNLQKCKCGALWSNNAFKKYANAVHFDLERSSI